MSIGPTYHHLVNGDPIFDVLLDKNLRFLNFRKKFKNFDFRVRVGVDIGVGFYLVIFDVGVDIGVGVSLATNIFS